MSLSKNLGGLLVAALLLVAGHAAAQSLVVEELRVPVPNAGAPGLEALLVKPAGFGRRPLAMVSHGSPREAAGRPGMSARGMLSQLEAFARRGFVAVAVLRRGYGSSPGGWAEGYGPCERPDYVDAGRAGAADIKAAIAVLARRDDVDASRILAVGVSAGGFATVALTADPPPGLVAAISFAGGRGSHGPDDVCDPDALVAAFKAYGERSRTPMLWVYAANDHFFGPALADRLHVAFTQGGGRAEMVHAPAFGEEGHTLFSGKGEAIWTPIVDRFLAREHLATPAAAAAASLDPPPTLGAQGRKDFATFLAATSHKAFAISPSGAYAWRTARGTTSEATGDALAKCSAFGRPCRLYAVDDSYAR